jgi:hypothetical protein
MGMEEEFSPKRGMETDNILDDETMDDKVSSGQSQPH